MTTRKTIALTRQTFVGKGMSLLFNMSRLVIAFLPRSKCLLISWLQSPSAVILEPKRIKSLAVSIISPSICHEVMGLDAIILVFWKYVFLISNKNLTFEFEIRIGIATSNSNVRFLFEIRERYAFAKVFFLNWEELVYVLHTYYTVDQIHFTTQNIK